MSRRRFTKMHGLGNDFVVFDATRRPLDLTPERARFVADRRLGVGCDQILVVEPAADYDADFFYRIYNADGSESGQCGNGARCFARFVREQGLTDRDRITVATASGRMVLEALADGRYRVAMGVPAFAPDAIPVRAPARADTYDMTLADGRRVTGQALAIGNPHFVLRVDSVDSADVAGLGPALESHPDFPERVNVGFMEVVDAGRIRLRVYERGAGETRACGSGAVAAAVAGRLAHGLHDTVQVEVPGGMLTVEWAGEGETAHLTGPAARVFDGELDLDPK
ncbi:diaminopimelate epimerase [Salinisphaera sp. PC39]|uniref:diaminopimelate epimerase n=1 Tax=Salinisphaera sp. PC39 TaxID=1304156 RepID=UPI00333FE663